MQVLDLRDVPNIHFDPLNENDLVDDIVQRGAVPAGQYGLLIHGSDHVDLVRDKIGCNKLFFGFNPIGTLVVGNRINTLIREGVTIDHVQSCLPGHAVRVRDKSDISVLGGVDISMTPEDPDWDIDKFKADVSGKLRTLFGRLAEDYPDAKFVVCLSGGLDSSVIASFATQFLPNVTAVSFSYTDPESICGDIKGEVDKSNGRGLSEDFVSACNVADLLGIPLVPILRPYDAVVGAIKDSILLGQDWRDFNVHCAVVNLFLAQSIRALYPEKDVVVLTGDLMNEYVCDYRSEEIDGTAYYQQPRISLARRRRFFVRGLDAGDREIGVFSAFRLKVVQPFSVVAKNYMEVPASLLEDEEIKYTLNGHLLNDQIHDAINKSKTRAQVGGKDKGTLGAFHRLGINQKDLEGYWSRMFSNDGDNPTDIIQFGRYRHPASTSPS